MCQQIQDQHHSSLCTPSCTWCHVFHWHSQPLVSLKSGLSSAVANCLAFSRIMHGGDWHIPSSTIAKPAVESFFYVICFSHVYPLMIHHLEKVQFGIPSLKWAEQSQASDSVTYPYTYAYNATLVGFKRNSHLQSTGILIAHGCSCDYCTILCKQQTKFGCIFNDNVWYMTLHDINWVSNYEKHRKWFLI